MHYRRPTKPAVVKRSTLLSLDWGGGEDGGAYRVFRKWVIWLGQQQLPLDQKRTEATGAMCNEGVEPCAMRGWSHGQ